jgi:hypothetical protein
VNNIELYTKIKKLFKKYNFGNLVTIPKVVLGGLLHKMYCVETEYGKYAVKCLNELIIKRPGVLKIYENSEKIAKEFKTIIPVVLAKTYQNNSGRV